MASCAASGPGASCARVKPSLVVLLRDPAPLLHQIALHVAGESNGPSKAEGAEAQEIPNQVAEWYYMPMLLAGSCVRGRTAHNAGVLTFILSRADRSPFASFTASSFAQKCTK